MYMQSKIITSFWLVYSLTDYFSGMLPFIVVQVSLV